ncbi:MAG: YbhB/YbcL family Raf kinase inhibitor-like protein [Candidatus Binatia bacterium]
MRDSFLPGLFVRSVLAPVGALAVFATGASSAAAGSFHFESDAFADGTEIPAEHTCDGADRSPALKWDGAPGKTKAFAIVMEDPDAPGGTFVHWLAYNIPDAARALGASVPAEDDLGDGTRQGTNGFEKIGYSGPCPPRGERHTYVLRLYALSKPLDLEPGAKRDAVVEALEGKILAEAEWKGHYRRIAKEEE